MDKKLSWVWVFLFAAVLVCLLLIYGGLPDRVAVHFDASGNPNGFQSKEGFLYTFIPFIFIMNGVFFILRSAMGRIPTNRLNIPWKAYWLSQPERKEEFNQRMRSVLALIGLFTNTVFLFTLQVIYQANTPNPSWTLPVNAGVAVIGALVLFLMAFTFILFRPPDEI